ncbi:capsule biosynthesis protein CapC [Erwiniaceae bacterium L1_54_3]|nr:capsule biosynthesis protein CapC [Erwiniaceae bacterium L1_54_3]
MLKNKKLKKLITKPSLFFKDYLNKKYPVYLNEIKCPQEEEQIIMSYDEEIEKLFKNNDSIDVVFTWVDNKDLNWKEKYNFFSKIDTKSLGKYAKDSARFENHDELYYSLQSVIKFLPWVKKIFLVTDNQTPSWLKSIKTDKIHVVDHSEIIPSKYLPTFNSHVIEAHLHKIKDISENFIYFNDDVFVARALEASHFFKCNGHASLFISSKSLNYMLERGTLTPTLSASLSSSKLLQRKFGIRPETPLVHTYVPLRKSDYLQVWKCYEKEIESFLSNKFRTDNDLNLATFLVPWFSYLKGKSIIQRDICYYFNIRSRSAKSFYKAIRKAKNDGYSPHSFCANDFNSQNTPLESYQEILEAELKFYYEKD